MKVIAITTYGEPDVLKIEERSIPEISADEVLIKVKAIGVNRPDIFQRKGQYPAPEGVPADIPGLEVAGVIEKTGEKVTAFKPGDKVFALLAGGGYAEYVSFRKVKFYPFQIVLVLRKLLGLQKHSIPFTTMYFSGRNFKKENYFWYMVVVAVSGLQQYNWPKRWVRKFL